MEKKLQRNEHEKMLAGVCAGMAEYFDVDVTLIRIAFVVATLAGFSGILVYLVLWIVLPVKPFTLDYKYQADYKVHPENQTTPQAPAMQPKKSSAKFIVGLILILLGAFFLLDEFNFVPYWFDLGKLWPLVLIIIGLLMLSRTKKRSEWIETQDKPKEESKPAPNTTANTETNTDTDQTAQ